ncbi:hypothetical protein Tco_0844482 [Tanacetum coccineum]
MWFPLVLRNLTSIPLQCKNALTIDSRQTSSYNNADTTTPVSFIAKSYSTLKGSSFLSIPVAIINMEPINMEAIIQLTASLFDKCYPLVLALAAIAISILALELGIYLAEPAKDGKEKTGNKVGEGVKNPPKGKKSDNKKPGCVHPSGWCQCNSCGCEETRHIPRMLSDISPDRCCGCGVRGPVNHCLMCEFFAHNYSTTPSEVNKEELPSSDLDILPEEPTDLVDSNTNDNESSSISEKSSQFWSIKDLNIITEDFLLDLKSNINRFLREVREDIARTLSTYDESVMETNETIRLNYQKITDQQTDPEQLAALTNHNTFLLNYLTGVTNIRDQLMDYLNNYLNSWDIDEGDNYRSRSSLVHSLYDTHTHRIIDLHNGFDWYASEPEGSEPEGSEPEGSEPEGSEPEGSETDDYNLNEEEDTKNTSDKGKHRCTENVSDKGKGKSKMTECIDSPSDSDPQDEMDRGV